jgi:hypothetical protein
MRRLRYNVAVSLDGFIAGPAGEYDWIVADPSIDFAALFGEFDTLVMGRKTFDALRTQPGFAAGMELVVASRTLRASDYPDVTIIGERVPEQVAALKAAPGKDVWLFGGGIELAVMPVFLGAGIPLLTAGHMRTRLELSKCVNLPSGIVMLAYDTSPTSP